MKPSSVGCHENVSLSNTEYEISMVGMFFFKIMNIGLKGKLYLIFFLKIMNIELKGKLYLLFFLEDFNVAHKTMFLVSMTLLIRME